MSTALKSAVDTKSKKRNRKDNSDDESRGYEDPAEQSRKAVREEIAKLKGELKSKNAAPSTDVTSQSKETTDTLAKWSEERSKYRKQMLSSGSQLKGADREKATMNILAKFQSKLRAATTKLVDFDENADSDEGDNPDDAGDLSWMRTQLVFKKDEEELKATKIDASATKVDEERYSIHDPRNPLNKRRREADKSSKRHRTK